MSKTKKPRGTLRRLIRNWAVPIGCGLLFLFLLKSVFFFGYVPSVSMEPAISEGSFVFGVRMFAELERGDVVVFTHDNVLLVKRVAGIPGDFVDLGGKMTAVPEEHYYLLGDNLRESIDSRFWSEPFVAKTDIVAILPFVQ